MHYSRSLLKLARVPQDLYDKKEFHNPGILELLMSQYKILEKGSNYPLVRRRSTARTRCCPAFAARPRVRAFAQAMGHAALGSWSSC